MTSFSRTCIANYSSLAGPLREPSYGSTHVLIGESKGSKALSDYILVQLCFYLQIQRIGNGTLAEGGWVGAGQLIHLT